ncbi:MAG TPA: M64 family metallopeptidase [Prolixibacteraceae bacterium]|nr:M64 family metallopeptidase [Prolixibacteraceae bacterium]
MKCQFWLPVFAVILCLQIPLYAGEKYNDHFTGDRLRFDFLFTGNKEEIHVFPVQIKMEPYWSGPAEIKADPSGYGNFRYQVWEDSSGELLFSRGFSSLFQEWQTTAEAAKMERAFYQALFFPFPKNEVTLKLEFRDKKGIFQPLYETKIDPKNYFILKETPMEAESLSIEKNGQAEKNVDLVFIADGYTQEEKAKYYDDVKRLTEEFFKVEPYSQNRKRFNVTAVFTPSEESGVDIPGEHLYKNTALNSTYYTFNVARYLTTSDMLSVYDAVSGVPWDFLVVLVNTERYGGGGVFNQFTVCSSGNELSPKVLVHELGHSFAGLADEYYSSEVAYEEFYPLGTEPWEPNITTLVSFDTKWKDLLTAGVPVPTPRTPEYSKVTGVFEGGGYMAKGIFSPAQDCRMKSNVTNKFCAVCSAAIQNAIDWYSK